jgi:uncharacterized protein
MTLIMTAILFSKPPSSPWLLAFSFFNALVMAGISLVISLDEYSMGEWSYRIAGLILQFTLISFLLSLLIKTFSLIYTPLKKPLAIILFATAQLIVITNLQIYSLYHFHINGMVMNLLFSGALLENIAFSWQMWISVLAIFLSTILIQFLFLYLIEKRGWLQSVSGKTWISGFLILELFFVLLNGFADGFKWESITSQNRYIPWLPPITMRSQLKKMGFNINTHKEINLSVKSSGIHYPLQPLECSAKKPYNIVFLVVDSLRFDMVTAEIMPFTHALKNQALNFENHFSGGSSTRYGMFSLFYGLNGAYWHPMLTHERGSILFDTTLEKNYQHFIYGSTKLTFPEFDRTIFSRLRTELHKGPHKTSAENDVEITNQLISKIDTADSDKPFFGFLFYDAPHAYSLPTDYPKIFEPRLDNVNYLALDNDYDPLPFLNLYKSTAHYVDQQIQRVVEHLHQRNLLENTLVIITSDHGQEFNETRLNYWGHNSNFSIWQTKVPLIMLWPGKSPANYTHLSAHEDILPSVMQELMGCSNPIHSYSTGQSLFTQNTRDRSLLMETWTERAIFYQNKVFFFDNFGKGKTYDENYQLIKNQKLPAAVIQDNLEKLSRFLKH